MPLYPPLYPDFPGKSQPPSERKAAVANLGFSGDRLRPTRLSALAAIHPEPFTPHELTSVKVESSSGWLTGQAQEPTRCERAR